MKTQRVISLATARRLAITRQHLDSPRALPTSNGICQVIRDIGCLQLDPLSAVERSHRLVVFSRVGPYDLVQFDALLYQERQLFEYWAHAASIVLTEDYPIHNLLMRRYARANSSWGARTRAWVAQNRTLKAYILKRLRREGPLPSRLLEEDGTQPNDWVSSGWTSGRNVSRMLDYLLLSGVIMVTRREGLQKWWDLSERVLPAWTPPADLSPNEVVTRAAQKSLRALGVATAQQIQQHYTRGRYPDLNARLAELERAEHIARVDIRGDGHTLKGDWYIHTDDLPLVEKIEHGEWEGRTVLLSPFDNLICDRKRTQTLFNFDFRIEIYTPSTKRKYGYYVLPILHGDQLIGRIDPTMNRAEKRLTVNALYTERAAPKDTATVWALRGALEELAEFLGAQEIAHGKKIAPGFKGVVK